MSNDLFPKAEEFSHRCSIKKVFLEISQKSQGNTCNSFLINYVKKEALAQVLSCKFCEISKNTFFHRTSLVAILRAASFVKLCCFT